MPTAAHDQPRFGPAALAQHVRHHITHVDDGDQLITVRHQPQGPVAYLFEPDDELRVEAMDIVGGNVITQATHDDWGTLYVLTNGPAVTEVCLHRTPDQAVAFRDRARELELDYAQVYRAMAGATETDTGQDVPEDG